MEGLIVKGIGGFYYVKTVDGVLECKAKGLFRLKNITPMVGDRVVVEMERDSNVISEILERTSELERPMVSNVTQAFTVFALRNPDINYELMNKFLIMLEKRNIKPVLVFNKADLGTEAAVNELTEMFVGTGYKLFFIIARERVGLDDLIAELKGNISVLCGPSGAGKSTLLNKMTGKEYMETGVISDRLKRGKHTTRHSELIEMNDGFIVDTPGFSTLELTLDPEELKDYFPEFYDYEGQCKFKGCSHNREPKCRVKEEVGKNISKERYAFYVKFLNELIEEDKKKWSK